MNQRPPASKKSERGFPAVRLPGSSAFGVIVECGGCGATDSYATATAGGSHKPAEAIARAFRGRGWLIGNTAKKDRCPACSGRRKHSSKEKQSMGMMNEAAVVDIKAPKPGASEAPPREMTREDRRIIFAKLEEVYVDERTGYTAGWNDHRVAEDLNCPRAWVEVIRDENFGPQKAEQSAEVVELRARLDAIAEEVGALITAADTATVKAREAQRDGQNLQDRAQNLARSIEAIRADLKKLVGGR